MNKAVIFDGDGTLWRPRRQGRGLRPDRVYKSDRVERNSHIDLRLVEGAVDVLKTLREQGYYVFIVSAHPVPGEGALRELASKLSHFGITDMVDRFFCSDGNDQNGKSRVIRRIIDEYNLHPARVFMVGDSYYFDYEAGKKAGVQGVFIKNEYCKQPSPLPSDVCSIDHIVDVLTKVINRRELE